MYVVTKDGYKLTVDTSSLPEDNLQPFQQTVGLYIEDTILKDVWILELSKRDWMNNRKDSELNFVRDVRFYHEPSQEEILWAMSAYGCTRGDIVIIRKGYELDVEFDDD